MIDFLRRMGGSVLVRPDVEATRQGVARWLYDHPDGGGTRDGARRRRSAAGLRGGPVTAAPRGASSEEA